MLSFVDDVRPKEGLLRRLVPIYGSLLSPQTTRGRRRCVRIMMCEISLQKQLSVIPYPNRIDSKIKERER